MVSSGCGPWGPRPGFHQFGPTTHEAVADWAFTDDIREIVLQARTWYLLPHSVTIWCAAHNGELFVAARNPTEKVWIRRIERDPDVRLKIDGQIYERTLEQVTDPELVGTLRDAYAQKYDLPTQAEADRPVVRYYHVVQRLDG